MFEIKVVLVLEAGASLLALANAIDANDRGGPAAGVNVRVGAAPGAGASPPPPPAPLPDAGTVAQPGATVAAAPSAEVDAAGVPFDPARHTGTKVKSGLWRMKVGVSRPANEGVIPGAAAGDPPPPPPVAGAGDPPPPPPVAAAAAGEDDEFAAFRNAAGAQPAPPPPVVAGPRTISDADLSQVCNDAALKDGNADRIGAMIARYVTDPAASKHSRNIHPSHREQFVQEVATTFGVQLAG